MRPHEINESQDFIKAYYTERLDIIEDITLYYNEHTHMAEEGKTSHFIVNKDVKHSFDLPLLDPDVFNNYMQNIVTPCMDTYIKETRCLENICGIAHMESVNIQRYPPGGGYPAWHCERSTITLPNLLRAFFWITYLNDIDDCGETEFMYQKIKIKPERGLTLIAPAEWMFTHRGNFSNTQYKTIVTSWFHFHTEDKTELDIIRKSAHAVMKRMQADEL